MSLINDNLFISRIFLLEISLIITEQQPDSFAEYRISFSQGTPHSQAVWTSDILHNMWFNAKLKLDWINTAIRSMEKYFKNVFITL
ncbi:MAG TPA: hypothetical protein PK536_02230 [Ignavibacteria bacterium]|nr:hypothetical protein [Ignavibacteria bacterium]HRJ99059.1 hypothetical protein [Ignavibacteria bacterium]